VNAQAFLPRSESKIVLALVIASYAFALDWVVLSIVHLFTPIRQAGSMFAAHGPWAEAIDYLVLTPIVASTVLVATIELLRVLRLPIVLQIVLSAAASCAINSVFWWPFGFVVAPLFLLSAYAYLRWRSDAWWVALGYTILIHVFANLPASINAFARLPDTPNRATQPTATRCVTRFSMIKTLPLRLALAPGSRR
jgi:hypothetical protein